MVAPPQTRLSYTDKTPYFLTVFTVAAAPAGINKFQVCLAAKGVFSFRVHFLLSLSISCALLTLTTKRANTNVYTWDEPSFPFELNFHRKCALSSLLVFIRSRLTGPGLLCQTTVQCMKADKKISAEADAQIINVKHLMTLWWNYWKSHLHLFIPSTR